MKVRICVNGSCASLPAERLASGTGAIRSVTTPLIGNGLGLKVSVALEASNGRTLVRGHGRLSFRKRAPNGTACGPICYNAGVSVSAAGTLTADPA